MDEPSIEMFDVASTSTKPQPKPKKRTKQKSNGLSRDLLNLISEIRSEYYQFVEEYPEYEFPLPNIKDENDILALHEKLEHQKKIQTFEYAVRDLPLNYWYGVTSIAGSGKKYASEVKQDQELFDKWTRFEAILQASFEDLNPMLVETLKLYPFLQRQKPHVLIRLGFHIKLLWDAASPQEPSERVEIPEDF